MSSHLEYHPTGIGTITSPGTLTTDRTGLQTCTATFRIRRDRWTNLPKLGSGHPVFTYIGMEHRELDFDGPWAVAKCNYAGIDVESTPPIYELSVGLSEEPIETHPDFVTSIGGTPMVPLNGAIFENLSTGVKTNGTTAASSNSGYVFREFLVILDGKINPFAKIENYLEASQLTWRKTTNHKSHPSDIRQAGKIDTPEGPNPPLASPRNWLNLGTSSTQRGSAYQRVVEWRASGRRGWSETVYGA